MNRLKTSLTDLAVFGGTPLSSVELHVGRPNVLDRAGLLSLINQALDRGWLSNDGPLVRDLEAHFAEFAGVQHAVAVANATLGLQLVAAALDIKGEVIMPSFTFIGTAHALAWMGLRPVFADVLAKGHGLDPADVASRITDATGAIVGVHLWGGACAVDELQAVADIHGVPIFFDAAHAIGSTSRGRRVGGFGRAEVFSLHATKAINALEAGLITTNDGELAESLRLSRNYSFTDEDKVVGLGTNAKLNEFSAAMGLTNLAQYDRIRTHNQEIHAAYRAGLSDAPGLRLLQIGDGEENSYHYAVLEIDGEAGLTRDQLRGVLTAENIRARRYFTPGCHRSPPYADEEKAWGLPVTERLSEALLQLPTGLQLDATAARQIGELVRFCVSNGRSISDSLAATAEAV